MSGLSVSMCAASGAGIAWTYDQTPAASKLHMVVGQTDDGLRAKQNKAAPSLAVCSMDGLASAHAPVE